jgi:hypothetical protein
LQVKWPASRILAGQFHQGETPLASEKSRIRYYPKQKWCNVRQHVAFLQIVTVGNSVNEGQQVRIETRFHRRFAIQAAIRQFEVFACLGLQHPINLPDFNQFHLSSKDTIIDEIQSAAGRGHLSQIPLVPAIVQVLARFDPLGTSGKPFSIALAPANIE